MANKHAILSPSGFKALMLCPAKPAMERDLPEASSEYADEGTAAHFLAAYCLELGAQPSDYIGQAIQVKPDGDCQLLESHPSWPILEQGSFFVVGAEMAEAVQVYIDTVRDYAGDDGQILIEQPLPIAHITGEQDAEGMGDTVILRDGEIVVIDLKYGRGVEVSAIDNPQLMLYGLGALEKFALMGDFEVVRMVISQPRVSTAPGEYAMRTEALIEWGANVAREAAQLAQRVYDSDVPHVMAKPHPEACRFCKAKATCPALASSVEQALGAEFTDLTTHDATAQEQIVRERVGAVAPDDLGAKMDAVEIIEMWCKAIRARCESQLLAGAEIAGYKLVAGKKGPRAWTDEAEAERTMKSFRLKKEQMYDMSVISPTKAEKVLKAQAKRWAKLAPLIKQGEGKPSVAPLSDVRPALAIQPLDTEFEVIADTAEDLV